MNFREIVDSEKPVLVDFFAEWCGPCKAMVPHLKALKDKTGDKLTIIEIDKNQLLAGQLRVQSVPALALYQNGQQLWRQSGM
ncbi:MAG: thioredoxin family protein [Siphonobacter sp.]